MGVKVVDNASYTAKDTILGLLMMAGFSAHAMVREFTQMDFAAALSPLFAPGCRRMPGFLLIDFEMPPKLLLKDSNRPYTAPDDVGIEESDRWTYALGEELYHSLSGSFGNTETAAIIKRLRDVTVSAEELRYTLINPLLDQSDEAPKSSFIGAAVTKSRQLFSTMDLEEAQVHWELVCLTIDGMEDMCTGQGIRNASSLLRRLQVSSRERLHTNEAANAKGDARGDAGGDILAGGDIWDLIGEMNSKVSDEEESDEEESDQEDVTVLRGLVGELENGQRQRRRQHVAKPAVDSMRQHFDVHDPLQTGGAATDALAATRGNGAAGLTLLQKAIALVQRGHIQTAYEVLEEAIACVRNSLMEHTRRKEAEPDAAEMEYELEEHTSQVFSMVALLETMSQFDTPQEQIPRALAMPSAIFVDSLLAAADLVEWLAYYHMYELSARVMHGDLPPSLVDTLADELATKVSVIVKAQNETALRVVYRQVAEIWYAFGRGSLYKAYHQLAVDPERLLLTTTRPLPPASETALLHALKGAHYSAWQSIIAPSAGHVGLGNAAHRREDGGSDAEESERETTRALLTALAHISGQDVVRGRALLYPRFAAPLAEPLTYYQRRVLGLAEIMLLRGERQAFKAYTMASRRAEQFLAAGASFPYLEMQTLALRCLLDPPRHPSGFAAGHAFRASTTAATAAMAASSGDRRALVMAQNMIDKLQPLALKGEKRGIALEIGLLRVRLQLRRGEVDAARKDLRAVEAAVIQVDCARLALEWRALAIPLGVSTELLHNADYVVAATHLYMEFDPVVARAAGLLGARQRPSELVRATLAGCPAAALAEIYETEVLDEVSPSSPSSVFLRPPSVLPITSTPAPGEKIGIEFSPIMGPRPLADGRGKRGWRSSGSPERPEPKRRGVSFVEAGSDD